MAATSDSSGAVSIQPSLQPDGRLSIPGIIEHLLNIWRSFGDHWHLHFVSISRG